MVGDVFCFLSNNLPKNFFVFEVFFLQFLVFYVVYLLFTTLSLFYVLFYLLLLIVYFGFILAFYQLELFSAFLWLAESVVIFVSLLLVFYLNVYDSINTINTLLYNKKNFILFFSFFFLALNITFFSELEFYLPLEFQFNLFWDDFYEALNNDKMNDIFGSMLSFYIFNSYEFLVIGFLLLVGSMICVNLNRFLKTSRTFNYSDFFTIFDVFKDFFKMFFMRKQNLVNQETQPASTRFFGRKV